MNINSNPFCSIFDLNRVCILLREFFLNSHLFFKLLTLADFTLIIIVMMDCNIMTAKTRSSGHFFINLSTLCHYAQHTLKNLQ